MQPVRLSIAFIALVMLSAACINVDGTTLDGNTVEEGGYRPDAYLEQVENLSPAEKLEAYKRERVPGDDPNAEQEFKAVENLMTGHLTEGIDALLAIEKATPGRYSTATNLGTGYELNGNNTEALRWITIGIERNPQAHEGTEWLHKYILETKIALAANPRLFVTTRMIDLPATFTLESTIQVGKNNYQIRQVRDAVQHQLHERMLFVKPPDPVVSELLFALGRIVAHTATVEPALKLLSMSRDYGFANFDLWDKTQQRYNEARFQHYVSRQTWEMVGLFAFVSALLGTALFLYIRKNSKRARGRSK